jgi:hypothetical protein
MRISLSGKEGLLERLKDVGSTINVVLFGTDQESINDMQPMWVPHDREYKLCALKIDPDFSCHFNFG